MNPLLRTPEVYGVESERWVLIGGHECDTPVRAEPFEAIELELARLWAGSPAPGESPPG